MNDPKRWLDTRDAPDEVLRLLTSAMPVRALPEGARRRSRRRIAGLASVPAAAGAFFWVPHLALGAALGTAVATAAVVAPRAVAAWMPESPPAAVHTSDVARRTVRSVRLPVAPPSAVPVTDPTGDDAPPAATQSAPVAPREASPEPLDLTHEARLLERARSLLLSDPALALSTLERHATEAPHGTLKVERELLEVDALVRLGRRRDAEAKARSLRGAAPGSIYERRLDELLRGPLSADSAKDSSAMNTFNES